MCVIRKKRKGIKHNSHFPLFPYFFCKKMVCEKVFHQNGKYFFFLTFIFRPNQQNMRKVLFFFSFSQSKQTFEKNLDSKFDSKLNEPWPLTKNLSLE